MTSGGAIYEIDVTRGGPEIKCPDRSVGREMTCKVSELGLGSGSVIFHSLKLHALYSIRNLPQGLLLKVP